MSPLASKLLSLHLLLKIGNFGLLRATKIRPSHIERSIFFGCNRQVILSCQIRWGSSVVRKIRDCIKMTAMAVYGQSSIVSSSWYYARCTCTLHMLSTGSLAPFKVHDVHFVGHQNPNWNDWKSIHFGYGADTPFLRQCQNVVVFFMALDYYSNWISSKYRVYFNDFGKVSGYYIGKKSTCELWVVSSSHFT